jgi:hypothetical protein
MNWLSSPFTLRQVAVLVASGAASTALAAALSVAGFGPRGAPPAAPIATLSDAMVADIPADPITVVDPIYIPAPEPQKTVTVHRTVAAAGGDSEDGSEAEGGDD